EVFAKQEHAEVLMSDSYSSTTGTGKQAEDNVEQSFSEPVRFLKLLRPNGPWVLTAITPEAPVQIDTTTAHTTTDIVSFVSKYNGNRNLYYSVNPTRSAVTKKATKADIAMVEFMHSDLDPYRDELPEAAKERYLKCLNGYKLPPTAVNDSGNGINALWRLETPIVLDGPEKIADIEARNKALVLKLGGTAGTQNVDRILRVPGTINLPNKKKREENRVACPTKSLSFNGTSYPLELFEPGSPD